MTLTRHPGGPILTRQDLPACPPRVVDPSSVFNPGAISWEGRSHLMLRVQTRGRETHLFMAESEDGVRFDVAPEPLTLRGIESLPERVFHVYDPRLTALENRCYAMLALDLEDRCELGLACSSNLCDWDFLGLVSEGDTRNGVLFPERVGGRYLRLDRPNRRPLEGGGTSGDEIWLSESEDLLAWRPVAAVAAGRHRYWDELVGAGPPPVKTRDGWLLVYHGIATHGAGGQLYQAGVLLLDLADPSRVLARTRRNILEPREPWELTGQVPGVVFPSGMLVDGLGEDGFAPPEAQVRVYYGAADTCVGLATATMGELLRACRED